MNLNKVVRPCGGKTQKEKFHEPQKKKSMGTSQN